MKNIGIAVLVYGILVCAGGVIGYLTAHSMASLVMGMLFGVALLICASTMMKNNVYAYYASMALTATLSVFFIYRFLNSWKIMPAGFMSVVSLAILGLLLANCCSIKKQTEKM